MGVWRGTLFGWPLTYHGVLFLLTATLRLAASDRASSADYAVAWGLVHSLMHPRDPALQPQRRQSLQAHLLACKQGFFASPEREFPAQFAPSGALGPEFEERWYAYIAAKSCEWFQGLFVGDGDRLNSWEAAWRMEISQIQAPSAPQAAR